MVDAQLLGLCKPTLSSTRNVTTGKWIAQCYCLLKVMGVLLMMSAKGLRRIDHGGTTTCQLVKRSIQKESFED
jgi:hypothetical protein